jgi:hypothetical protein
MVEFEFCLGGWLEEPMIFVVYLSFSKRTLGYFKISHSHFLPQLFYVIIHEHCYINDAVKKCYQITQESISYLLLCHQHSNHKNLQGWNETNVIYTYFH